LQIPVEELRTLVHDETIELGLMERFDESGVSLYTTRLSSPPPLRDPHFPGSPEDRRDALLRNLHRSRRLTRDDVAFQLGCSRRQAELLVKTALADGLVQSVPDGARVFYVPLTTTPPPPRRGRRGKNPAQSLATGIIVALLAALAAWALT